MSVLITVKIKGDVEKFRRALSEREADFVKVSKRGREAGAIHHRFGVGDGVVLVIDEWDEPSHFESFFSDPEMQAFISEAGGDVSSPPEVTVVEAVESADSF